MPNHPLTPDDPSPRRRTPFWQEPDDQQWPLPVSGITGRWTQEGGNYCIKIVLFCDLLFRLVLLRLWGCSLWIDEILYDHNWKVTLLFLTL